MNKKILLAGLGALLIYKGKDLFSSNTISGEGWDNLHPEVKARAKAVIKEANKHFKPYGLSVGVFEGVRSIDKQQQEMRQGDSFIKDALRSYHVWGLAVDFVFIDVKGNWTWEPITNKDTAWYEYVTNYFTGDGNRQAWNELGAIIKKQGFEWGGDWRNFDGPHAQLTTFGRSRDLIAQYGEPENLFYSWA